jgi:transglutaminase-like putative cysteine protease
MNRINQIFALLFFIISIGCEQKPDPLQAVQQHFEQGNFAEASIIIDALKPEDLPDSIAPCIEILKANMERIQFDFSKTEPEIRAELAPFYPELTEEQLRSREKSKSLEMRMINGERRYFKYAVRNLFRIDKTAGKIRDEKLGTQVDSLELFCLEHTEKLIQQTENGKNLLEQAAKFRIDYSIILNTDEVPAGEIVKCWMPFPRESAPRQKNVQFVSANTENYQIADNNNLQRSIYFEKTAVSGQPTVFEFSATFEIAPQYTPIEPAQIKPYDTSAALYREFTAERPPHLVFSEPINTLTDSLTNGLSNPYEKAKAIFYWIDQHVPWASALEYSIIECIPKYVLENRHGDCGMKTLLFMSMARTAGIPCKWQSGWMLHPGEINLHDWCEVYYEGIGWVPVDQSFGLQNSDNQKTKEFYLSGIDEYRWIVNDDFSSSFEPLKKYYRSEPIDFQRGELEWKGGNLYFNQWDYQLKLTRIK